MQWSLKKLASELNIIWGMFVLFQNVNGGAMPSSSSGPVGADFKPLQSVAPTTSYQSAPVPSAG